MTVGTHPNFIPWDVAYPFSFYGKEDQSPTASIFARYEGGCWIIAHDMAASVVKHIVDVHNKALAAIPKGDKQDG